MVTKEFIKTQMIRLESNYGVQRFKITQDMFDLWVDMFKDLNADGFKASIDEYIRTNEFPPTVASILNIYNQKLQRREELLRFLIGKYTWLVRWYEVPKNKDTFKKFMNYVCSFPESKRKMVADDLVLDAIGYYNDNAKASLDSFLENYKWMQKDR